MVYSLASSANTGSTFTPPAPDYQIMAGEQMTFIATVSLRPFCSHTFATKYINPLGYWLKVSRIDTTVIAAQMVNNKLVGYIVNE
jgi:hypothetical protein